MTFPKKTKMLLASLSLVFVVGLSSCDPKPQMETIPVTGPYMTGKDAKTVYNAYLGQSISTLNSSASQSATNVRHLANLIDGLVMNDEFGILERQLASSAWHDESHEEFRFTIRDGVAWYDHTGEQYVNVDKKGNRTPQFVTADDFLHAAEIILNYANNSEVAYMVTLFVDGGWEYYCYTEMISLIKDKKAYAGRDNWGDLKSASNDEKAAALMELIAFETGSEIDDVAVIDGDDLSSIANFSRVGIIANDQDITYRLNQPARFFPTLLTYAPFYPINRAFYKEIGAKKFGTSKENTLYNGPYICSEWTDTKVSYTRNEHYYDIDKVHVKKVNYIIAPDTISSAEIREAFDAGIVDGFTVSADDAVGWEKYITGPNKTGTIQNPYSSLVNSRELDTIDYTWHFTLNVEREENLDVQENTIMSVNKNDYPNAIANTNKALKIKEVRRLVLDAINFEIYNESNERTAPDNIHQYQLNTFVPKGYVFDENDKDYNEYYYEEYGRNKGIDTVAEVKALVGPQTIAGVNYTQAQVNEMLAEAQEAVTQYNALNSADPITLPIYIEYAGQSGYAPSEIKYEAAWINDFNKRANGGGTETNSPFIKMINNTEAKTSNASSSNAYGAYYTLITWGWIGDYADPLTYMNCYKTNGDMSLFSGTKAARDNYYLDDEVLVKGEDGILGRYDSLVNSAKSITNSDALRYEEFAKAEYELINNTYIVKPHSMNSQGWSVSVSRALGYEMPTAPYGLAGYRLTGLWVLVDPPTGEEREAARDLHAANKVAALAAAGSTYNYVGSDEE